MSEKQIDELSAVSRQPVVRYYVFESPDGRGCYVVRGAPDLSGEQPGLTWYLAQGLRLVAVHTVRRAAGGAEPRITEVTMLPGRPVPERSTKHGEEPLTGASQTGPELCVPKLPRLLQGQINSLIEKGNTEGLAPDEQTQLDEALDYLDDLTIFQLERLKLARQ